MRCFLLLMLLLTQALAAWPPRFETLREHALSTPAGAERSLTGLAGYLGTNCRTDEEKAWSIYCWVTDRVAYDLAMTERDNTSEGVAEQVLQTRKAVCVGYAELYAALARAVGLDARVVSGWAKGYGFSARQSLESQIGHAWNTLKLGGRWVLLDPTWGAGGMGPDERFQKEFKPHWFRTPPRWFAYTHLPREEKWQLLPTPLKQIEFQAEPLVRPAFFDCALRPTAPLRTSYQADPELTLRFEAPVNIEVHAELDKQSNYALVETEGPLCLVSVRAPRPGKYDLRLFSGFAGDMVAEMAAAFTVRCKRSSEPPFPESWTSRLRLFTPRNGVLPAGLQEFRLRVPGAKEVTVEDQSLTRNGNEFTGKVTLKRGTAVVYADRSSILKYEVR